MERLVIGVQLPGGVTTGPITGGFIIVDPAGGTNADGTAKQIVIPATTIVNSSGVEIGNDILDALNRIADSLEELRDSSKLTMEAITN